MPAKNPSSAPKTKTKPTKSKPTPAAKPKVAPAKKTKRAPAPAKKAPKAAVTDEESPRTTRTVASFFIAMNPDLSAAELAAGLKGWSPAEVEVLRAAVAESPPELPATKPRATAGGNRPTHSVLTQQDSRDEMYADPARWAAQHADEAAPVWPHGCPLPD